MGLSLAEIMAALPEEQQRAAFAALPKGALSALRLSWKYRARPEQITPGAFRSSNPRADWTFWALIAGRGFGKSRTAAEWAIEKARSMPGSSGALAGRTLKAVRKEMLADGYETVEGSSGILAISPPDFPAVYEPSKQTVTWPTNGSKAMVCTAEEPESFRGPNLHWFWADELAAWGHTTIQYAWDMLLMSLRIGDHPQACISTTPRPIPIVKGLIKDPRTVITRGTSYDNAANLSQDFLTSIVGRYEGTRLARQELYGDLLEDNPGALWSLARIDELRVKEAPRLSRVIVAIDPAVSTNEDSDETGIVVAGTGPCRCLGGAVEQHGFVIADISGKYTPLGWAREAIARFRLHHADRIVAEVNNGGDLVEANLRTVERSVPYKKVTASRGKAIRAEPIAALYEQGKVHHVGTFQRLEDQLTEWDPSASRKSPDRLDALVFALSELMGAGMMPPMEYTRVPTSRWDEGDEPRRTF